MTETLAKCILGQF